MYTILLVAILPALVLVYFIYRKDKYEREPTRMLVKAFAFGALSALASFLISGPFGAIGLYPAEATTVGGHIRTALFGAAIPEEVAKFVLLWLCIRKSPYFDEYVDGIVYAVCVGMGFAAFENVGYVFGSQEAWLATGIMRAIVSIPAHFFFAVAMGYYYSKATFDREDQRKLNIALALIVPIALHAAFDAILMVTSSVSATVASGLVVLFLGLYIYMLSISKKRIKEHLETDAGINSRSF